MFVFLKRFLALIVLRWPFILLGAAALLHILKVIQVDGYGIGLILIAFLPALLPVISTYFKTIKIGKDGIEATTIADNEGRTSFELKGREEVSNSITPTQGTFPYSIDSRRVLATLWHFQKELFGENSNRRWGFGVGIGATDYGDFSAGVAPLRDATLIHVDHRGLCYLTNEGVDFCREHRVILDADCPYYSRFTPAANNG
jgi:hypothetical protein